MFPLVVAVVLVGLSITALPVLAAAGAAERAVRLAGVADAATTGAGWARRPRTSSAPPTTTSERWPLRSS